MPAALVINIAVWAFILIACVVLAIRAYNKRSSEDFEKRDN
jgi:multisubunit Na+/H+ antiporter MnhC subunit